MDTNLQSLTGAVDFNSASTFQETITTITGNILFCNTLKAPNNGLHIQFVMFNREFNIDRDGKMWMSSSGGQWETQMGDANVGRVWVKDRFGLGAVGVACYKLNCAGRAIFTNAVQFIGTDKAVSLNNGSFLHFNDNGSTRRYTLDTTYIFCQ